MVAAVDASQSGFFLFKNLRWTESFPLLWGEMDPSTDTGTPETLWVEDQGSGSGGGGEGSDRPSTRPSRTTMPGGPEPDPPCPHLYEFFGASLLQILSPSRSLPMTTLPTLYRHRLGKPNPTLSMHHEPISRWIASLQQRYPAGTSSTLHRHLDLHLQQTLDKVCFKLSTQPESTIEFEM